jgi:hypothetical protein
MLDHSRRRSKIAFRSLAASLVLGDILATLVCWAYLIKLRVDTPFLMSLAAVWIFSICSAILLLAYVVRIRLGHEDFGPMTT